MDSVYSSALDVDTQQIVADSPLQRHLDALRLRDGAEVQVVNGRGSLALAVVERTRAEIVLHVQSRRFVERPSPLRLALGLLDHRDRFEFAVEKAVELGVTQFSPLHTDHVQVRKWNGERLMSKAIAALTQSGQAWLPQIDEPMTIDAWLQTLPDDESILVGHPSGASIAQVRADGGVTCCIGPEGGFSQRELDVLNGDHRAIPIAIGRSRLRAETAAIALVSAWVGIHHQP